MESPPSYVQDYVETAINGRVASQVVQGRRSFDLLVRMGEPYRSALGRPASHAA